MREVSTEIKRTEGSQQSIVDHKQAIRDGKIGPNSGSPAESLEQHGRRRDEQRGKFLA